MCIRDRAWNGDESMHPFWAIRRMPASKVTADTPFNMAIQHISLNTVTVGAVDGQSVSMTAEVIVPFLTNTIEIPLNGELRLEVEEVRPKECPKKRTWKTCVADDKAKANAAKREKADHPQHTEI